MTFKEVTIQTPDGGEFGDYIVFADESGDHGTKNIDPDYPLFVLLCCVIKKPTYIEEIIPAMTGLKFKYWGHDTVILHENDIRKNWTGDWVFLRDAKVRENFLKDIEGILERSDFQVFGCIVDKREKPKNFQLNLYEVALQHCLTALTLWLADRNEFGKKYHIICESRGGREDFKLKEEFRRMQRNSTTVAIATGVFAEEFDEEGHPVNISFEPGLKIDNLELLINDKKVNSVGLQIADLLVRPLGLSYFRPQQNNRALAIIKQKIPTIKTRGCERPYAVTLVKMNKDTRSYTAQGFSLIEKQKAPDN
ncbi:MAG: DUF3800 domain-containing protein [Parvibaculales bacterium]